MKLSESDFEYFLKCCEELGITVKPGTGKITVNGQPINVKAVLDSTFIGKHHDDFNLFESLQRGLEEAIEYENGEIELRTDTLEE